MREVTFTKRYEHRLNERQVAVYLAGRSYTVNAAVAKAAEAAGAIPPPPAPPTPQDDEPA